MRRPRGLRPGPSRQRPSLGQAAVGALFIATGTLHFLRPGTFTPIVPDWLPAHRELVFASGVAELAGGVAVLYAPTRVGGGWWLIATLVAVFPANVDMALHADSFDGVPEGLLWARLPLQAALIAWVWRVAVSARR